MDDLTRIFEQQRARLHSVAYRILGERDEAQDAVQEAWLRLNRSDVGDVDNLAGWLTTVVSRICLDMLRSRQARREAPAAGYAADEMGELPGAGNQDPAETVELSDGIGLALLAVLDTLSPAERVAFVLHDVFDVPFGQIAAVLGRSPATARQLASRARRRVRGEQPADVDSARRRQIVAAFLAAARGGDLATLLELLDPEAVTRADAAAREMGSPDIDGGEAVARFFSGAASSARLVLLDAEPALVWAQGGRVRVAFRFTLGAGRITRIDFVADTDALAAADVEFL